MNTLIDCCLNGISLSSLDEALCVLDVKELSPKMRISALSTQPDGRRILRSARESLSIEITFAIHREDPRIRRNVQQAVHAWAEKGGVFTVSDRPGQQLRMQCAALPEMASQDWTAPLTLTLVSVDSPYWEDVSPAGATGSGAMTLDVPGTAGSTPVSVLILNDTAQTVTRLNLHGGSTRMTFDDLNFTPGSMFILDEADGILLAEVDGVSVLPCRTPDSNDRLLLPCGRKSTVYASADQRLTAAFTARGRYV